MTIKCIENNCNNGNFTLEREYEIRKNPDGYFGDYIVTSDFMHVFADENVIEKVLNKQVGDVFDFVLCKFKVINGNR